MITRVLSRSGVLVVLGLLIAGGAAAAELQLAEEGASVGTDVTDDLLPRRVTRLLEERRVDLLPEATVSGALLAAGRRVTIAGTVDGTATFREADFHEEWRENRWIFRLGRWVFSAIFLVSGLVFALLFHLFPGLRARDTIRGHGRFWTTLPGGSSRSSACRRQSADSSSRDSSSGSRCPSPSRRPCSASCPFSCSDSFPSCRTSVSSSFSRSAGA